MKETVGVEVNMNSRLNDFTIAACTYPYISCKSHCIALAIPDPKTADKTEQNSLPYIVLHVFTTQVPT